MRRKHLAQALKLSIIILISFKSIQLLSRVYYIIAFGSIERGTESYRANLLLFSEQIKVELVFNYIIIISFIVILSVWFFLKYKRAHQLVNYNLTYKPIWALFSFVIPIFNLFAPYKIMNEMWTVYNKDMNLETFGKKWIKTWWFLSIGLVVFSRYLSIQSDVVSDMTGLIRLEYLYILLFAASIHYYFLLNRLVKFLGH